MASQTQFKQQCPSCEAMVPIKDASLIGKKVDCPKCKYRFVVEDPGNLESDGRPATAVKEKPDGVKPGKAGDKGAKAKARARADADDEGDDDGKGKKKKAAGKKGGSMMLILGIVLALVALIGLIVGGILIFGGSSDSDSGSGSKSTQQQPKPNPPRTGGTTSGSNPTATGAPAGTGDGSTGGDASPAAATGPGAPVTNLLPNETQVVYSINVNKFMASTLGGAAFHSASGFQPATFRDGLGLPLEQMSRFLRAESLKSKWVFNIVHMFPSFSIKADAMKAKLGSQKGPKSPIKGQEYYLVAPNETLDSLSAVDLAAMFNPAAPAVKVGAAALAWHLYDEQTLVVGEVGQVEQFLQSGRQPTLRTQVSDRSSGGFGPMGFGPMGPMGMGPMGMGPMGMSPKGMSPMGMSPMGPMGVSPMGPMGFGPMGPMGFGPMGPMGPGAAGGGGDGPLFSDRATYLTLHPDLKRMMDKMEETRQPVILSCAGMELESVSTRLVDTVRAATTLGALIPLPTITAAGLGLHTLTEERLTGVAAIELRREDDARALDDTLQKTVLPRATTLLGKWMGTTFSTEAQNTSPGGPGEFGPMGPGMFGPMGPGMFGPMGPGAMRPGGTTGPGGFGPMGPGMMGPMGMGGMRPGGPMGPGMMGPMGPGMIGPMGPGGFGPMGGGEGAGSADNAVAKSFLRSWFVGKVVYVSLNAEVNASTDRKIRREIENQVVRMKGSTDMAAMTRPRLHELANTAVQMKNQKRKITGTFPLAGDASGAVFVTRPPNQRVGWMVDLLPYLGRGDVYNDIDTKQSWRSDKNLQAAGQWVPQFLNPTYPRSSWQARVPSLPGRDLGATHYTALSGIGLDSAEWPDDDAHHKKLGLFGYDRPADFDSVTDGLSNTIYMITVQPNLPRPWIAGGGATVQGVPETNSIAPFVYDHGGQRGAYVLMADGSVRFLNANTPDKVFQALVTKAGGEDFGVLDALAPRIPAPNEPPPKPKSAAPTPVTTTSADGNWKEYVSNEGSYSVMMPPGQAKDISQDMQVAGGKVAVHAHLVDLGVKGRYLASVSEIPAAGLQDSTPEQIMQGAKMGFMQTQPGLKATGEKKISLGVNPGLEVTVEGGGATGVIHLFMAKQRMYMLVVAGPGQMASSADAKKFLDSFKLTN